MWDSITSFMAGLRRYSIALAGVAYLVLQQLGVAVPEDVVKETVETGFNAWDQVLAVYASVMALLSAWKPKPALGTK